MASVGQGAPTARADTLPRRTPVAQRAPRERAAAGSARASARHACAAVRRGLPPTECSIDPCCASGHFVWVATRLGPRCACGI
ncbi:hypothetical protein PsYK624_093850 [Phanerochaete sordida]|uniref:Uncharacterized protein n=1 Tax=Phanerochaete sordida TaxID=48140 RepID=A0A9P3GEC3_9APHY|nr:hypothetical protein PsYK624_093850 [Phanerochaete sordida]